MNVLVASESWCADGEPAKLHHIDTMCNNDATSALFINQCLPLHLLLDSCQSLLRRDHAVLRAVKVLSNRQACLFAFLCLPQHGSVHVHARIAALMAAAANGLDSGGPAIPRDMAQQLPSSMQGEPTPASLVNQNGQQQEHDGQTISTQQAVQKLQDNEQHGATWVAPHQSSQLSLTSASVIHACSSNDNIHRPHVASHNSVHDFDADATPQQKKAQALKSIQGKLPKRIAERHEGGTGA